MTKNNKNNNNNNNILNDINTVPPLDGEAALKNVPLGKMGGTKKANNRILLGFHLISMFGIGIGCVFLGFGESIRRNISLPIKLDDTNNDEVRVAVSTVESFIPLMILNKINKIPFWIRSFILYFLIYYCYKLINSNFPEIFIYKHIIYACLLTIFIIYYLYLTLELITIIYFTLYKGNILENKIFKRLPKVKKEELIKSNSVDELIKTSLVNFYTKAIIHYLVFISLGVILQLILYFIT